MKNYKSIFDEIEEKDREIERLNNELTIARRLIDEYYGKNKHNVNEYLKERKEQRLSEGARRLVHDIMEGKYED